MSQSPKVMDSSVTFFIANGLINRYQILLIVDYMSIESASLWSNSTFHKVFSNI